MGFVGIYLAYGCFRTLTRKPISASLRTYESVLGQALTSKYNNKFPDKVPQSGLKVSLRKP